MLFTRRRFVQRVAPVLIAPVLAFPAAAQQVQKVAAAGGPDFSKCDQIRDPAASAQCYTNTSIAHSKARVKAAEARGAAADARGAEAERRDAKADAVIAGVDSRKPCIEYLQGRKAAGVTLVASRLTPSSVCAYAVELGMQ